MTSEVRLWLNCLSIIPDHCFICHPLQDLVIHVCDRSHPDCFGQQLNVMSNVKSLLSPDIENSIITIHNKIDLIEE